MNSSLAKDAIKSVILPKVVCPGILIQEAKLLPKRSPTLKRRKTDTAVKYLVAQSLSEAEVSDLTSTATDGKMSSVTLNVVKMLIRYTQLNFKIDSVVDKEDLEVEGDDAVAEEGLFSPSLFS